MQWHPIFAHLLRPLVQDYYDVQTNMAVGDAPRASDIVLVRRTSKRSGPFRGVWRHLTTWNVLEFKGPSVDPRLRDLELLVELGLGIDRRLNEERTRQRHRRLAEAEVSFWYLATHLGERFQAEAQRKFGELAEVSAGVWRCVVMQRLVYLISIDRLPVDHDSVPMHLLAPEPASVGLALGQLVIQEPGFWDLYSSWLLIRHREIWEEIQKMARAKGIEPTLDLRPAIEMVGLKQVIDQVGLKEVIKQIGIPNLIAELDSDPDFRHALNEWLDAHPTRKQRRKRSPKSQQPDEAPED